MFHKPPPPPNISHFPPSLFLPSSLLFPLILSYPILPFQSPPHLPTYLPPHLLQLRPPQRRIRNQRKPNTKPNPNISPPPGTRQLGHRANIPKLIHTNNSAGPPNQKRNQRRNANGQIFLILPPGPIEANIPSENKVFFKHNAHPNDDPITHQCQEIGEDDEEVVPARDGADKVDEHDDANPAPAGDQFPVAAEDLAVQGSGISA